MKGITLCNTTAVQHGSRNYCYLCLIPSHIHHCFSLYQASRHPLRICRLAIYLFLLRTHFLFSSYSQNYALASDSFEGCERIVLAHGNCQLVASSSLSAERCHLFHKDCSTRLMIKILPCSLTNRWPSSFKLLEHPLILQSRSISTSELALSRAAMSIYVLGLCTRKPWKTTDLAWMCTKSHSTCAPTLMILGCRSLSALMHLLQRQLMLLLQRLCWYRRKAASKLKVAKFCSSTIKTALVQMRAQSELHHTRIISTKAFRSMLSGLSPKTCASPSKT